MFCDFEKKVCDLIHFHYNLHINENVFCFSKNIGKQDKTKSYKAKYSYSLFQNTSSVQDTWQPGRITRILVSSDTLQSMFFGLHVGALSFTSFILMVAVPVAGRKEKGKQRIKLSPNNVNWGGGSKGTIEAGSQYRCGWVGSPNLTPTTPQN